MAPPTADPVEPAPFVPFPRQGLPQKDFGLLVFDSRLIAGEPEPPPSVFLPIAGRSQPEGLIRFLTSRLKPETPAAAPATPVVFFPLSGVIQPPPISPRPSRLQFEPQVSPLPLLTRGRVPFDFAVARNVSRVKLEASPAAPETLQPIRGRLQDELRVLASRQVMPAALDVVSEIFAIKPLRSIGQEVPTGLPTSRILPVTADIVPPPPPGSGRRPFPSWMRRWYLLDMRN